MTSRRFSLARALADLLRALLPVLCVLALPSSAAAQLSGSVREGNRIKLSTPFVKKATGTVKSISADSVVLFTETDGATLAVATSDIRELKVSRGRSMAFGARRGAMWGGAIGALAALAIIPALLADDTYDSDGSDVAAFALQSTFGGIIWGAGIGAFVKAEKWESSDIRMRSSNRVGVQFNFQPSVLH